MAITTPDATPVDRIGRRRRRQRMSAINVTPFVDVMLVLLIVFMVTAPLLTVGVSVDLPETRSSPLPGQDEPLTISVTREGKVFLQESEIALSDLGPRLMAITERKPDARIFVRGDRGIAYGEVMEVVGTVHDAGFTRVALVTEPPERSAGEARQARVEGDARQPRTEDEDAR